MGGTKGERDPNAIDDKHGCRKGRESRMLHDEGPVMFHDVVRRGPPPLWGLEIREGKMWMTLTFHSGAPSWA